MKLAFTGYIAEYRKMGKKEFYSEWLSQKDSNNQLYSFWCTKKDEYTVSCRLCSTELKIEYMGFFALKQHSEKEKHRKLAGIASKPEGQTVLQGFFSKKVTLPKSDTTPSSSQSSSEDNWLVKDVANKAEIIAIMQFVANNTLFSSANGLATLYQAQFPDSVIAKNVSLSGNKMSYITAHALGPYFTQATVSELKEGSSYFTLHFDETLNAQVKKQMDLLLRYWSEQHQEVRVKYFTSVMFGHAKAEGVVKEIMDALQKWAVPLKLLMSLGMDGPNVNKAVCSKVNQLKEELGEPPLVMCPQTVYSMCVATASGKVCCSIA